GRLTARSPLSRRRQWGEACDPPGARASALRATRRVPDRDVPPAADFPPLPPPPPGDASAVLRPVNLPMGLPQSMQNCAPGSFARPQRRRAVTGGGAPLGPPGIDCQPTLPFDE